MAKLGPTEKTNRVFKVEVNHSIGELTISVIDGSKPPLVFHRERAHETLQRNAEMLGWKNTIVDTAAKERDENGQPASVEEKYNSMLRRITHCESGTDVWSVRAGSVRAARSEPEDTLLIEALMEVLGQKDRAKIAAAVKSWNPNKRNAVRARDDVKVVVDRMIAESAADVDTEELLEDLMDAEDLEDASDAS